MLLGDNELTTTKNAAVSLVILIAMQMRWYDAGTSPDGAHPGLH
jgi:hypothetical protein